MRHDFAAPQLLPTLKLRELPLSFIAGIYGMNFNTQTSPWNMPELNWYFGYPFALTLMAITAFGMLWYFYRKRWLF